MSVRPEEVTHRARVYAAQEDIAVASLMTLAAMDIERVKSALTRCQPDELAGLQGEIRALSRLQKWVREPLRESAVDK